MTKERLEELGRLLDAMRDSDERAEVFEKAVKDAQDEETLTIEIRTSKTIARVSANPGDELYKSLLKMTKDLAARIRIYGDELERQFTVLTKSEEAEK